MDEIQHNGETFKLACLPPPENYVAQLPRLSAAPGFRVWEDDEIMAFLKKKTPRQRRLQFSGLDWVMNQGQVGSCCPTATTKALRMSMALTGANELPKFNPEFLYAQINRGVDQGAMLADASRAIRDVGTLEDDGAHKFNRDIFQWQYSTADAKRAAANRAGAVFVAGSFRELATLVLSGQGAAVVAVHVTDRFMKLDGAGYAGASRGPGNHAVCIPDIELVGGKPACDMSNSWGLEYGDGGFAYLDWDDHLAETVKNHQFFAILSANATAFDVAPPAVE